MARSILIAEWMIGGGQYLDSANPGVSRLAAEGHAMLTAIANDFAACGFLPKIPVDVRFAAPELAKAELFEIDSEASFRRRLQRLAEEVDFIFLIAPESDGRLVQLCSMFLSHVEKLLSPDVAFIELASDKSATIECLAKHGIKIPFGSRVDKWRERYSLNEFPLPAILKPNHGAGSEGNVAINDWATVGELDQSSSWRIENLCNGVAASISILCGGEGKSDFFLPPTLQLFAEGEWVDCEVVMDKGLVDRATRLAKGVVDALPNTRGYIGIDFMFGETERGDTVIEVNPRLTSSYLKLRQFVGFNIAEKMLEICTG